MPYPWSAGNVLTATDLNSALAAKSDYAPTQNTQSGTGASAYTFVLADATRLTVANAATAATYTIPPTSSVAWATNSIIQVTSIGAGVITFAGGAGVTVTNTAATLAQYASAALIRTGLNAWTVLPFSGTGSATYSATTGSPAVDTTTRPGKTIVNWTGSGSVTVDKAGTCEALVIGGGGAGMSNGPGGGAGGYVETTTLYLPAGTHTVTVGSGGASALSAGAIGQASRVGIFAVAVGGGTGTRAAGFNSYGGSGGGGSQDGGGVVGGTGIQGSNGGTGNGTGGGGGGGAGAVGANSTGTIGGVGGNGTASSITGASVTRAGGGGGGGSTGGSAGGTGGGGTGGNATATAGSANTGGGGGGVYSGTPGAGGTGRVILVFG